MKRLLPLVVAALVSGCGSGSPGNAPSSRTATSGPAKSAPKRVTTQTVSIKGFDFHPKTLTVAAGTTVRWVNHDASNHTVTGEDGASIKLGNVDEGMHVQMRFTTSGTYKYYCEYHPNMHARIVVR